MRLLLWRSYGLPNQMERTFKLAFWLTFSGVVLIVVGGASYLYLIWKSPLEFNEMDFDNNGFVTFSELYYASSYETRKITENGMNCIEYYALKDGFRLKLICTEDRHF
jgi:hypothetical protein